MDSPRVKSGGVYVLHPRAGVLGQQAAYAAAEPQAVIDAFLAKREGKQ